MEQKVFITPFGGHGTVFLTRRFARHRFPVYRRPDISFGWDYKLNQNPTEHHTGQWRFRTHRHLNLDKTIEWNLVDLIKEGDRKIFLCGMCSRFEPFLTNNKIEALCLIRHPLYSFTSFFARQHPAHARRFGGINTDTCVNWYIEAWTSVVTDMLNSGSPLIRYEFWFDDLKKIGYTETIRCSDGFKQENRGDTSVLKNEYQELLRKGVSSIYKQCYPDIDWKEI